MAPNFIVYVASSLDGYIARTDGAIDWLSSAQEGAEDSYNKFYSTIDALVMGATIYEQVLSFGEWVYPGKQTYVLTRRSRFSSRSDITFVQSGVEAVVEQVIQQSYKRIWIVGGGDVASSFLRHGLVNELIIVIIPIVLGSGIPLFQSVPEQSVTLISTRSLSAGAVELHYQVNI